MSIDRAPAAGERPSRFDLNLLRSLDVILAEANLTRAAERQGVTQQAMSVALQKLRMHFSDPLLIRVGRQMELTPLGAALVQPVQEALSGVQAAVHMQPAFDPSTSSHEIRVALCDSASYVLVPRLFRALAVEAPYFRCHIEPLSEESFARLERGTLDLCIVSDDVKTPALDNASVNIKRKLLYRDVCVCVMDTQAYRAMGALTRERYEQARHLALKLGQRSSTALEDAWKDAEIAPDVAASLSSSACLVQLLEGTDFVATLHRRLAEILSLTYPISLIKPPIAFPDLRQAMLWHDRNATEPASGFVRGLIHKVSANFGDERPA